MAVSNQVEKSTFLVTGGAGFIGSGIVHTLLADGAREVRVFDNLSRGSLDNLGSSLTDKRLKFINGDIRDRAAVDSAVKGVDYVFHEAVIRVTHAQDDPRLAHEVIADGGFNIIESSARHRVRRLVVSSSTTVYGEPAHVPIDEGQPYLTVFYYGAGKVYTDMLLRAAEHQSGLDYVCLRPFNVYGPRMDITSKYQEVIPVWLDALDKKQSPQIHGKGTEVYDFTYVDDIVAANLLALRSNLSGRTYNVGTGTPTTLNDLALKLAFFTGNPEIQATHVNPGNRIRVSQRVADITRATKELGYIPRTSLDEGLKKTIEWRKKALEAQKKKRVRSTPSQKSRT